jgi:hypothetical protein
VSYGVRHAAYCPQKAYRETEVHRSEENHLANVSRFEEALAAIAD